MEENLQVAGTYSFTVYNADRGAERYTYQWLDKEYREVLIAVEDQTVEIDVYKRQREFFDGKKNNRKVLSNYRNSYNAEMRQEIQE